MQEFTVFLFYIIVNWISLGGGLLVWQNKKAEDFT